MLKKDSPEDKRHFGSYKIEIKASWEIARILHIATILLTQQCTSLQLILSVWTVWSQTVVRLTQQRT